MRTWRIATAESVMIQRAVVWVLTDPYDSVTVILMTFLTLYEFARSVNMHLYPSSTRNPFWTLAQVTVFS